MRKSFFSAFVCYQIAPILNLAYYRTRAKLKEESQTEILFSLKKIWNAKILVSFPNTKNKYCSKTKDQISKK